MKNFRFYSLESRVEDLECIYGSKFINKGSEIRVEGLGSRVRGSRLRVKV